MIDNRSTAVTCLVAVVTCPHSNRRNSVTTSQRTSVCPRTVLERSAPYRPPSLTCDPLTRSELFDRLDGLQPRHGARVVVLSAPAGTGKTVLLLDWIDRRLRTESPATTVAWLTVTEAFDRNRARWPVATAALGEALGISPQPAGLTFVAHLINEITERTTPTVLVIDDADLITDSFVLAAVEYAIRHAPPTMTIVLSGRYEPPLRWHTLNVEDRLLRLRKWELALTRDQVAQMFSRQGCELDEAELNTVMELTQGWTALVRIAALVVAGGARDRAAALAVLARPTPAIADYFASELLRHLPEPVMEFLIRTSVPDRFTEALADELCDTRTHETLDELQRTGFPFVRAAENGELWFTYHPMLRAYLRTLAAARGEHAMSELRLRTARGLCDAGLPAAALPHLLALDDREQLRKFLCDNGVGLIFEGAGPWLLGEIDQAGAGISDDPFIWRLRAIDAVGRGDDRAALAYVELIRAQPATIASLASPDRLEALGFAVAIDAVLSAGVGIGDLDVRTEVPATGNLDIDCYLAVQTASALLLQGRIEHGEALLRSGITLAERTGRHRLILRSLARLTTVSVYTGSISTARARAEHAVAYAREHDLNDVADTQRMLLLIALTRYIQGEEFNVEWVAAVAAEWADAERSGMPITGQATLVACQFLLSRGGTPQFDAVNRVRTGLIRLLESDPRPTGNPALQLPGVVRSMIGMREVGLAQELVDRAQAVLGDTPEVVLGRAMLADTARRPRTAKSLLESLLAQPNSLYPVTALSAWLRYASVVHQLDMPAKTTEALEAALRISAADALVSPWLDVPEAIRLLDLHSGQFGRLDAYVDTLRHHPAAVRRATSPMLTESETIVLKHLPSRRTGGQIAADLGVSINTVKTHLRGIYTKLDATSREHAVVRARLAGLL